VDIELDERSKQRSEDYGQIYTLNWEEQEWGY